MSKLLDASPRSIKSEAIDMDSFVWSSGRHNPQSKRVCHFKGLLDLPICIVRDDCESDSLPKTVDNSAHEPLLLDQDPIWRREYARIAVGSLPLCHSNLQQPSYDTIASLRYFTGLQNFSVRQRPFMNILRRRKNDGRYKIRRRFLSEERNLERPTITSEDCRDNMLKSIWRKQLRHITGTVIDHLNWFAEKLHMETAPVLEHPASWIFANDPRTSKKKSVYSATTGRLIEDSSKSSIKYQQKLSTPISELSTAKIASKLKMSEDGYAKLEIEVFYMICSILQTNDTVSVQRWLQNASEREKQLMMDIVYTAMANQKSYYDHKSKFRLKELPTENQSIEQDQNEKECKLQTIGASETADRLILYPNGEGFCSNDNSDYVQSNKEE